MEALTLWQPYGELILTEAKRFETRSWDTSHRGPLLIHAAKQYKKHERRFAEKCYRGGFTNTPADEMPLGALIGICEVLETYPTEHPAVREDRTEYEERFGDFTPGRYAWALGGAWFFDEPIPWRGNQQLWNVEISELPEHAVKTVSYYLDAETQDSV